MTVVEVWLQTDAPVAPEFPKCPSSLPFLRLPFPPFRRDVRPIVQRGRLMCPLSFCGPHASALAHTPHGRYFCFGLVRLICRPR
eukprot:7354057-Pyramimonas_sp.AAC.1